MKMVIRDYFAAFRMDQIKANYAGSNLSGYWYLMACGLVILPALQQLFARPLEVIIRFYVTAVLLLFALYAALLHPVALSKLLYLCPMSEAERRAYIRKSYGFKIGFAVGLSVLGMGVLRMFGWINGVFGLIVIAQTGAVAVCNSLVTTDRKPACGGEKESFHRCESRDGWETLAIIVSLVCIFLTMLCAVWSKDFRDITAIVAAACMVCMELPLTLMMAGRVKPALERAIHYENVAAR